MRLHISGRIITLICLLLLISAVRPLAVDGATERSNFKDDTEDVISDLKKGPLNRLQDIEGLEGEEAEDFSERPNVDIASLTIIQNDTYISFLINVVEDIQSDANYTYIICGYRSADPDHKDPFDFIIEYSSGESRYRTWEEGGYRDKGNASMTEATVNTLNITMNRNKFILGSRDDPYIICAMTILYIGEGKQRYIDFVLTEELGNGGGNDFDETTWIIAQVVFIGFLIIGFTIIWNIWSKKKGVEEPGGVCPKCEARLDQGLDFCPHCGTFIRGPEADKANPKPRIVSPLDIEE